MTRINRFHVASRVASVLLAGALAACSDAPTATSDAEDTLARQVAALGFRADMIEDHGEYVVVEGDIRLSRAQLRSGPDSAPIDPLRPRFQYRTHALVGSPAVNQVVVDLSGLASEPGWAAAARDAMTAWNAVPNSYVRMVEGSPGNISVGTNCGLPSNVAAQASWPSGGNPGPTIQVNPCFGWTIGHAQRVHNMVHEFGHTLGLRHTNWQARGEGTGIEGAVHVPGTPTGNDNGSVMNGGTALNSWAGFSAADLLATRTLYPLPLPPNLVSSYPAGMEVLTWDPVPGATGYDVRPSEHREINDSLWGYSYTVSAGGWTTVTGTSMGTGRPYTGAWYCMLEETETKTDRIHYLWEVRARFTNGTSETTWVLTETATC